MPHTFNASCYQPEEALNDDTWGLQVVEFVRADVVNAGQRDSHPSSF